MHLKQLIKQYLEYLRFEKNKSDSTCDSYERYLNKFYRFAGNIKTEKTSYNLVRRFLKSKENREYSPNYMRIIIIVLRGLFRYANAHKIPCVNFLMIDTGQRVKKPVVYLEKEELKKLLRMPDTETEKGLRDRAILEVFVSTGLRVGELVKLKRDRVRKNNSISIVGKGNWVRLVFLSKRARKILAKYLKTRKDDNPFVFPITKRTVERIVKNYSKQAGIKREVTPHTLRHSFAVNLLENGANLFYIKEILGHKCITTTEAYLHVADKRLKEIHNKFHKL